MAVTICWRFFGPGNKAGRAAPLSAFFFLKRSSNKAGRAVAMRGKWKAIQLENLAHFIEKRCPTWWFVAEIKKPPSWYFKPLFSQIYKTTAEHGIPSLGRCRILKKARGVGLFVSLGQHDYAWKMPYLVWKESSFYINDDPRPFGMISL